MDSSASLPQQHNALHNLAAVGGLLLGLYLLGAAYGHTAAVWPAPGQGSSVLTKAHLMVALPAVLLATTGLVNIVLCTRIWSGARRALKATLAVNTITSMYLVYLLSQSVVPNHPIGMFALAVISYVMLLGAIELGLVWPAAGGQSNSG